jgi:hypothetical protein
VNTTTSKTQPALIGGLVIGVLSALPIIAAGNYCCCLWIIGGGVLAAYLLQQNSIEPITQGDAAITGLMAGIVGAFVYVVILIALTPLIAPMQHRMLERILDNANGMPPEFRELMSRSIEGPLAIAIGFLTHLVLGAIFATIGGLLGAVFFRKPLPPATDSSSSS